MPKAKCSRDDLSRTCHKYFKIWQVPRKINIGSLNFPMLLKCPPKVQLK